jgi:N-acetylmuramoyl-L-alanine amidase
LNPNYKRYYLYNIIIITILLIVFCFNITNQVEAEVVIETQKENIENSVEYEVVSETTIATKSSAEESIEVHKRVITETEREELAKLVKAEAGIEPYETKMFIAMVVLNRVDDKTKEFPNSIHGVIFQPTKRGYQFSPIGNGSFKKSVPDQDCYNAVDEALLGTERISGALYFESCSGNSWHSKNLKFLFKSGKTKFYR